MAAVLYDLTLNPSRQQTTYAPPAAIYLALHIAAPDDQSYGNEATYGGYARAKIDSLTSEVVSAGGGEYTLRVKNNTDIIFRQSDGPDQQVTHWAIWDSETLGSGNIMYSGALSSPNTVVAGKSVIVSANQLSIDMI